MTTYKNLKEHRMFEDEVRRVAEAKWQLAPGDCQAKHYVDHGKLHELDGIVQLEDVTHLIMATVSTRLDKVKEDVEKLGEAEKFESRKGNPVGKWLITEKQLEAQHIDHARRNQVKVLTLTQFRDRVFDGAEYLSKRKNHMFGSARDLKDGSITISETEYVGLPILLTDYDDRGRRTSASVRNVEVKDVANMLIAGNIIVLTAPFGAGKSLTTREIFFELRKKYFSDGHQSLIPLVVNLREHWGQPHGDEILDRHARIIGFSNKANLTSAWRAGLVTLMLDGFDELATQAVVNHENLNFMREARFISLEGVRDLTLKIPREAGVLICGRDHYFDDMNELIKTLGLVGRSFKLCTLGEFSEDKAHEFLKKHEISHDLPDWLPRKPLILGYLAHRGLLARIVDIDSTKGFGYAWDEFLRLICEREAAHEKSVMDSEILRKVLECLACDVRTTASGTGPITSVQLTEAYKAKVGQNPTEGVLMQLQRLPGLAQRDQDASNRSFIDEDLLSALQGSAAADMILSATVESSDKQWLNSLTRSGVITAAYLLNKNGADEHTAISPLKHHKRIRNKQHFGDCLMIALELAKEAGVLDCKGVEIDGAVLGVIDLEEMVVENLKVSNAIIEEIIVGPKLGESKIEFSGCMIKKISGVSSLEGLPKDVFRDCSITQFDNMSTNSAILHLSIPESMKALLTVLRKLYCQAGSGRRVSALKRGLTQGVLDYIDDVLQILGSEKMITIENGVVHPIRRQTSRALKVLSESITSQDIIVEKVRAL